MQYFKKLIRVVIFTCRIFWEKQYTYRASALAFTTLFAIVPYAIVMLFIAAWSPSFSDMLTLSKDYILSHFVPSSSAMIESYFENFIQQANSLPTLNIFFFIVSAIIMINTIEGTLNDIWETNKSHKIYFSSVLYCIIIVLIPITIFLSAALSSYVVTIPTIAFHTFKFQLSTSILFFLPIITDAVIFSLIYILVPNVYVGLIDGALGGFLAAILLEIARFGFGLYVTMFPSYALIYGVFSIIPIFLIWLYVFWLIFIFCALITAIHSKHTSIVLSQ